MSEPRIDTIVTAPWAPDLVFEADSAFVLPIVVNNDNAWVELPCDVEKSQCD